MLIDKLKKNAMRQSFYRKALYQDRFGSMGLHFRGRSV